MSNYITKSDVIEPAGLDTSNFAEIADLGSSNSDDNKSFRNCSYWFKSTTTIFIIFWDSLMF